MNCWPYSSDSFCAISRPRMSVVPPAANGTTTLTTRVGHCACADARPTNGSDRAAAPAASTVRRLGLDMDVRVGVRSERIILLLQFLRVLWTGGERWAGGKWVGLEETTPARRLRNWSKAAAKASQAASLISNERAAMPRRAK